jgi:hypothetical protein
MAWHFKKPLYSLSSEDQNKQAMDLWESESMGGIMENNNRLPLPVVYLLVLTMLSAYLLTFPLWGQRPTAAIYEEYVALMNTPEVQTLPNDAARIDYIVKTVESRGSAHSKEQVRHPVSMDDLRVLEPIIANLKSQNARLEEQTVLGNTTVLANFEGNIREDGTVVRTQPWWDTGYFIDIFYIIYFCLAVLIVVKRLPPYIMQPTHGHEHGSEEDDEDVEKQAASGDRFMYDRKVSA